MYNRYIPQEANYAPIPPSGREAPPPSRANGGLSRLLGGLLQGDRDGAVGSKVGQTLSTLLGSVGLKELDTGDILLALIVLFLILEDGDDLELLIALGLMILLNLGEQ